MIVIERNPINRNRTIQEILGNGPSSLQMLHIDLPGMDMDVLVDNGAALPALRALTVCAPQPIFLGQRFCSAFPLLHSLWLSDVRFIDNEPLNLPHLERLSCFALGSSLSLNSFHCKDWVLPSLRYVNLGFQAHFKPYRLFNKDLLKQLDGIHLTTYSLFSLDPEEYASFKDGMEITIVHYVDPHFPPELPSILARFRLTVVVYLGALHDH